MLSLQPIYPEFLKHIMALARTEAPRYFAKSTTGQSGNPNLDLSTKYQLSSFICARRKAYKELSSTSLYPTLGKDTTLPQYRSQDKHFLATPQSQANKFPVWYFFYGTLASVSKLTSLLSLPENDIPVLHQVMVSGGKIETWGNGKYNALVDGNSGNSVTGFAYRVLSEER